MMTTEVTLTEQEVTEAIKFFILNRLNQVATSVTFNIKAETKGRDHDSWTEHRLTGAKVKIEGTRKHSTSWTDYGR
jgi:hypothetical protein